jgi:hypothetical protein
MFAVTPDPALLNGYAYDGVKASRYALGSHPPHAVDVVRGTDQRLIAGDTDFGLGRHSR